jgi:hypothetical protein
MKTRVIVLFLIGVLVLGLTASAAASGPPWPAVVVHDAEFCDGFTWPSSWDPYETWLPVPGTGIEVQQPQGGILKVTCHMFIDFDNPDYLSLEAACQDPGWYAFLCKGKGTLVNTQLGCDYYWGDEWISTGNGNAAVNQTGRATATCLFHLP